MKIFGTCIQVRHNGKANNFAPYHILYASVVKTTSSNPEKTFLRVPHYRSSIHKSKTHFNNCFSYDAPNHVNDLPLEI